MIWPDCAVSDPAGFAEWLGVKMIRAPKRDLLSLMPATAKELAEMCGEPLDEVYARLIAHEARGEASVRPVWCGKRLQEIEWHRSHDAA